METNPEAGRRKAAYHQKRLVDRLGRDLGHQEIRLEDQNDSGMDRDHQDRRKGDNRQEESDPVGENLVVVVVVADAAGFVGRSRDGVETVVPKQVHRVSSDTCRSLIKEAVKRSSLRRKATEDIHTVLRSRWLKDLHPKMLHHRTS